MKPTVLLSTNLGDVTIELFEDDAPITVKNFLDYVDGEFFDGTIFHRVIPGFMVQGGGFTDEMKEKDTGKPIQNEAENGLKNGRGWLAMARTSDVNSATAQFFINLKDNSFLDHSDRDFGYAVFGRVSDGMDVVDSMAKVETASKSLHENVPVEPLVVKSARRVDAAPEE